MGPLSERFRDVRVEIRALRIALGHDDVPAHAKAAILLAVGYALNPIDLVPDWIPVAGQVDDVVVVPLLLSSAWWFVPGELGDRIREQAEDEVAGDASGPGWFVAAMAFLWSMLGYAVAALVADR